MPRSEQLANRSTLKVSGRPDSAIQELRSGNAAYSRFNLMQDGERICGEHFVATTGLARLDEGEPGTVLGQARGSHAVIVINSTRNGVLYLADMQHTKDEISWRLVGPVTESKSGISPIIPAKLSLMKDSSEGQQRHLDSVRSAPCNWPY